MAARRYRNKVGGKKEFYVVRNKKGQIKDVVNIGKSIKADTRTQADKWWPKKKVGHGHQGDYSRKGVSPGMFNKLIKMQPAERMPLLQNLKKMQKKKGKGKVGRPKSKSIWSPLAQLVGKKERAKARKKK